MKKSYKEIYERRIEILNIVKENDGINLKQLHSLFPDVSELTLRRDIDTLDKMNKAFLEHGCVYLAKDTVDHKHESSSKKDLISKSIARVAASLIEDGSSVFINSSSLALKTAMALEDKAVDFISNNLSLTNIEHHPKTKILLSGGEIKKRNNITVGEATMSFFSNIMADYAILGISSVSALKGLTSPDYSEAQINHQMIVNTKKKVIVVADFSKFGPISSFKVSEIENIDCVITDEFANPMIIKGLKDKGIEVIQVNILDN